MKHLKRFNESKVDNRVNINKSPADKEDEKRLAEYYKKAIVNDLRPMLDDILLELEDEGYKVKRKWTYDHFSPFENEKYPYILIEKYDKIEIPTKYQPIIYEDIKHTIEMIKSVVTEAGYKLEINSGNKHYMITFKPIRN